MNKKKIWKARKNSTESMMVISGITPASQVEIELEKFPKFAI
jgi:hypothetical protein